MQFKKKLLPEIATKCGGALNFSDWEKYQSRRLFDFLLNEDRQKIYDGFITEFKIPRTAVRFKGLSGLGKTRLIYEAALASGQEIQEKLVYVDCATENPNLLGWLQTAISGKYEGVLIVDNCKPTLHEALSQEVLRQDSKIGLFTLDHNLDSLSSTKEFRLEAFDTESIKKILEPLFASQISDLDRIAQFAQGFPQMAVLIAEARLEGRIDVGKLNNDEIARRLLGEISDQELLILKACSLFDRFGFDGEVVDQYKFISDSISGTTHEEFTRCIKKFEKRGLIDISGRFAQVVPKPLAVRLASEWWGETHSERQISLVDELPKSLIESFCTQITMLSFLKEVQELTVDLCGIRSPFGQAEAILSDRGSLLFRAFVEVNPEATSASLYRVLTELDHTELLKITDSVRRNLVWALEKLAFHSSVFEEASWCLMLLASAENESWSNNATGQFEQLFGVFLSGTEATLETRLRVLERALGLNNELYDAVVIKALTHGISSHSGSRTVGAEYQGNNPPLTEYRPKFWQEIFDYWDRLIELLTNLILKENKNSIEAQHNLGFSIRGLVGSGRIDALDKAIESVIKLNGRYWPSALESIKIALEHDESLPLEGIEALQRWNDLLKPDVNDLNERLKIVVIHPPWEHSRDDNGNFQDIARQNAQELASEICNEIILGEEQLLLLLNGQQIQTYAFGARWGAESKNTEGLIAEVLTLIETLSSPNINFLMGLLAGIYGTDQVRWEAYVDKFGNEKALIKFYPDVIRTGKIKIDHLEKLLSLIQEGKLDPRSASALSYGSVTSHLSHNEISDFCIKLSTINAQAAWTALDVLFMYSFGESNFDRNSEAFKIIVPHLSLDKKARARQSDLYHWTEVVQKFISAGDFEFSEKITQQIIQAAEKRIDFDDLVHSIKPTLSKILAIFGDKLWDQIGKAIIDLGNHNRYRMLSLLEREDSFSSQTPSMLNFISIQKLIEWCKANIEIGPYFVARAINIFYEDDSGTKKTTPLFLALLETFGHLEHFGGELSANLGTKGWTGSLVPYLESDRAALEPLLAHTNHNVRNWTKNHINYINRTIEHESIRDDENQAGI